MKLLQMFGLSYQCLQNYELKESVKHFHNLPSKHRNSLWVLTQLGQAMMSGEKFKKVIIILNVMKLISCQSLGCQVL